MIASVKEAANKVLRGAISDDEARPIARTPSQRAAGPDRLRVAERFPRIPCFATRLVESLAPCHQVESDKRHGGATALDGGVGFDARFQSQRMRQSHKIAQQALVESTSCDNLERGLTGKRLHRGAKRSGGGVCRKVNGNHHGYAECDGD